MFACFKRLDISSVIGKSSQSSQSSESMPKPKGSVATAGILRGAESPESVKSKVRAIEARQKKSAGKKKKQARVESPPPRSRSESSHRSQSRHRSKSSHRSDSAYDKSPTSPAELADQERDFRHNPDRDRDAEESKESKESDAEDTGSAPIPVTIVSWGKQSIFAAKIEERLADIGFDQNMTDLCPILKSDPAHRVKRGENGRYWQTRDAVFRQHGFADVIIEHLIDTQTRKIASHSVFVDSTGVHRADTVGRGEESWGNSLVDSEGNRVLNCMHFSCSDCTSIEQLDKLLLDIQEWTMEPWILSPRTDPRDPLFYGFIVS